MNKTFSKLVVSVLAWPRLLKRLVALLVDFSMCVLTVWLAYYLRLGEFISFTTAGEWAQGALLASATSIAIALPIFVVSGLYRAIFRYSGWPALLAVAQAVGIYGLLYVFIFTVFGVANVPRTIGIIQPILLLLFVGGRFLARIWLGGEYLNILKRASRSKVLISEFSSKFTHLHNEYLDLMYKRGLAGMSLYLVLYLVPMWFFFRPYLNKFKDAGDVRALALTGMVISMMFMDFGLTQTFLSHNSGHVVLASFWMCVAALMLNAVDNIRTAKKLHAS